MNKYHFTTIVSKDHLYKFIVMYTSLRAHCSSFIIYVLCANKIVYKILNDIGFENTVLVNLKDIEDGPLLEAKKDRIFHAYCWTLKPFFLYYVMVNYPNAQYFCHLDADLFFFESPDLIFNENAEASLFLTHHRNSKGFFKFYNLTGIYNTGFVGCKNDAIALECVKQWKDKCIEYCPIKEDPIKRAFGDQRYVEEWPEKFEGVHVVNTLGANTALWNITNYKVKMEKDRVYVNDDVLIFYHFSGLAMANKNVFNICWYYHIDDENTIYLIYLPYLISIRNCIDEVKKYFPDFSDGFVKKEFMPNTHFYTFES